MRFAFRWATAGGPSSAARRPAGVLKQKGGAAMDLYHCLDLMLKALTLAWAIHAGRKKQAA